MLRNVHIIYQVTSTKGKSWNIKKLRRKVNMLQHQTSLKQMNFNMECFPSLLITINTEVIIFNIRLSIITKLNHEIREQWHLAPCSFWIQFIHELAPRSLWLYLKPNVDYTWSLMWSTPWDKKRHQEPIPSAIYDLWKEQSYLIYAHASLCTDVPSMIVQKIERVHFMPSVL